MAKQVKNKKLNNQLPRKSKINTVQKPVGSFKSFADKKEQNKLKKR
jgi:hypothetical protein